VTRQDGDRCTTRIACAPVRWKRWAQAAAASWKKESPSIPFRRRVASV
jgi:hypothetical protein